MDSEFKVIVFFLNFLNISLVFLLECFLKRNPMLFFFLTFVGKVFIFLWLLSRFSFVFGFLQLEYICICIELGVVTLFGVL